jgi:hypothetical protein
LAANTDSLQTTRFGNEKCFAKNKTISAANADSLQTTQFQQRTLISKSAWFLLLISISAATQFWLPISKSTAT